MKLQPMRLYYSQPIYIVTRHPTINKMVKQNFIISIYNWFEMWNVGVTYKNEGTLKCDFVKTDIDQI